jgi:hypothetical protein
MKRCAKWVKWTKEEDATVLQMRNDGCSWEDTHAALPRRSILFDEVERVVLLKVKAPIAASRETN